MPEIIVPSHLDTPLYNALRSVVIALERQEIKKGTLQTARNLKDGDFALVKAETQTYLYTKSGGTLYRIPFQISTDTPLTLQVVQGVAKEVVADAPLAPRVSSLVKVIEVEVRADEVDTRVFEEVFNYEIGKSPEGKRFEMKWYMSAVALQARTPEVDPTQAPITVGWIPETPVFEQGAHVGILRYKLNPNTSADFNFFGDITLGV